VYPIPLIDSEQVERFKSTYPSTPLQSSTELRDQDDLALQHAGRPPKAASHIQKLDEAGFGLKKAFKMQSRQDRTPRDPDWSFPPKKSIIPPLRKLTTDTLPLNSVVCYAVHTADTPGKFDPVKANSLGVPIKQRATLVKGAPVTLEGGKVVNPSDCIGPSIPGKIFLIVDCPNVPLLQELVKNSRFTPYQRNSGSDAPGAHYEHVVCLIHITPADILTSPQYQEWMLKFNPEVSHIVINGEHCARPFVYNSSARLQVLLNHVHSGLFPLQYASTKPETPLPVDNESGDRWPKRLTYSVPLLRFCLAPNNMIGTDLAMTVPEMDAQEIVATTIQSNSELVSALAVARSEIAALPPPPPLSEDPVDVIFLGTGSATPSKYRSQSSTYVNVRGWGGFLLDTGEGALGQLSRHFGPDLDQMIAQLKCVFISHMHADHHLGLIRIILKHQQLCNEPLVIVGPPLLRGWLFEYCQIEYISYIIADNYDFVATSSQAEAIALSSSQGLKPTPSAEGQSNPLASMAAASITAPSSTVDGIPAPSKPGKFVTTSKSEISSLLKERLGIVSLEMAPVIHCMDSFGMAIEHQDGWKICFSGDTRPVQTLVSAGAGATLLIHEATFEDGLANEAEVKCHATTSEAIEVGNAMGAKFLMMTHFSQRYPKIPTFDASKGSTAAGIAFDMMRMRFSDFELIPKLTACLQLLFAEPPASDTDDEEVAGDMDVHD
jgi:ribonuclease Z